MLVSDITKTTAHYTEMLSTVINDSLLHNNPQLSWIDWNRGLRHCIICCHSDNLQITTPTRYRYL